MCNLRIRIRRVKCGGSQSLVKVPKIYVSSNKRSSKLIIDYILVVEFNLIRQKGIGFNAGFGKQCRTENAIANVLLLLNCFKLVMKLIKFC